jgi:hypothetical protein
LNKLADAVRLVLFLASRGAARKVAWLFKKKRVSLAKSNDMWKLLNFGPGGGGCRPRAVARAVALVLFLIRLSRL